MYIGTNIKYALFVLEINDIMLDSNRILFNLTYILKMSSIIKYLLKIVIYYALNTFNYTIFIMKLI